jgi:Transposase DDE domain
MPLMMRGRVYDDMARHGGIAAVPLNQHGHPTFERDTDGVPLCPKGLRMHSRFPFQHTNGYRAQRYACPPLHPERTGETCDHEQFKKGKGCVKDSNIEAGGIMRVTLDRTGPLYQALYTQRTCCERINSQAEALGIEQPMVRNIHSVRNLHTLIYLISNVRALYRAKSTNRKILQIS